MLLRSGNPNLGVAYGSGQPGKCVSYIVLQYARNSALVAKENNIRPAADRLKFIIFTIKNARRCDECVYPILIQAYRLHRT